MKLRNRLVPLGAAVVLTIQVLVSPAAALSDETRNAAFSTATDGEPTVLGDEGTGSGAAGSGAGEGGGTGVPGETGTGDSGESGGTGDTGDTADTGEGGDSGTSGDAEQKPDSVKVDPNADQDDEGWGATLFKTIQGAVTAVAEGGTVTVEPGTYAEQVEITKDLVLKGAGAGKTIIKAPEPVAAWEGSMPDEARYAIVYVHDAADVQIEGITVDGQGKGDEIIGLTGIAFYNAGGSVRNSIIKSLRADSAFARQDGDGVFAQAESGKGPFTLELTGNTISDYQKNGIEISGAVNATILANAVKTEPTSEVAQNGIQLLYGATGKVIGNIVSGNQYTCE